MWWILSGSADTPLPENTHPNHFTSVAQMVDLPSFRVTTLALALARDSPEVVVVFLHVPAVDEDVVVDGDAALDPCKGLADLMVEDACAVGGPEEQPLHPVQSLVRLEDTV